LSARPPIIGGIMLSVKTRQRLKKLLSILVLIPLVIIPVPLFPGFRQKHKKDSETSDTKK
jgi:hypothetical protein